MYLVGYTFTIISTLTVLTAEVFCILCLATTIACFHILATFFPSILPSKASVSASVSRLSSVRFSLAVLLRRSLCSVFDLVQQVAFSCLIYPLPAQVLLLFSVVLLQYLLLTHW